MRILLAHHFPFDASVDGQCTRQLARALVSAGHQVHAIIVDRQADGTDCIPVRRIVCREQQTASDDLPFDVPCFATQPISPQTFETLSDAHLAEYRAALRQAFDEEVHGFDPHLIHAQHVWVMGQLALETGVPYVLTAWGPELLSYAEDTRYRGLADQAAENAGAVFIAHSSLQASLASTFDGAIGRTVLLPLPVEQVRQDDAMRDAARQMGITYVEVYENRCGRRP